MIATLSGNLWTDTWIVVFLGMVCVFIFLFLLVQGLKMMSSYVNGKKK